MCWRYVLIAFAVRESLAAIFSIQVGDDKQFKFNEFMKVCPNEKQVIRFDEMKFHTNASYFAFDYTLVVPITMNEFKLELYFWRCPSAEALDNCVQFSSFKSSKGCQLMHLKNAIWTKVIECLDPPFKCPGQAATYVGKDCAVDVSAFKFFPLIGSYWKLKVKGFVDKQPAYCSTTEGYMSKL